MVGSGSVTTWRVGSGSGRKQSGSTALVPDLTLFKNIVRQKTQKLSSKIGALKVIVII
jgi:hypothetical protein